MNGVLIVQNKKDDEPKGVIHETNVLLGYVSKYLWIALAVMFIGMVVISKGKFLEFLLR